MIELYAGYVTCISNGTGYVFPLCENLSYKYPFLKYCNFTFNKSSIVNLELQKRLFAAQDQSMNWLAEQIVVFHPVYERILEIYSIKYLYAYSFIDRYKKMYMATRKALFSDHSTATWVVCLHENNHIEKNVNIHICFNSTIRNIVNISQLENSYRNWLPHLETQITPYYDFARHFEKEMQAENYSGPIYRAMEQRYIQKWTIHPEHDGNWFNNIVRHGQIMSFRIYSAPSYSSYSKPNMELFKKLRPIGEGQIAKEQLSIVLRIPEANKRIQVNDRQDVWGKAIQFIKTEWGSHFVSGVHSLPSLVELIQEYLNQCEQTKSTKSGVDYITWRLEYLDQTIQKARDIIVRLCVQVEVPSHAEAERLMKIHNRDGYLSDRHGGF